MKKILLSLLLSIPLSVVAQSDIPTQLVVWMQDGSQTTFLLSKTPRVTVGDKVITVRTTDGATVTLSRAEVHKYTLGNGSTGISSPFASTDAKPRVILLGDLVQISGLQPGAQVSIITLDGKAITSDRADNEGRIQLSLSQQGRGIYLIKTPSSTIKILKK